MHLTLIDGKERFFCVFLGLGSSTELDRLKERDEQMRSKYIDPIEHFPDKIDQLLDALNRVRFIYCVSVINKFCV